MSRIIIEPHQCKQPNTHVVVGWDWPLNTYYAQIHDHNQHEDDQIIASVGNELNEIHRIDDLKTIIGPYVNLNDDVCSQLYKTAHGPYPEK